MRHTVARQSTTAQVTAIEPDESLYSLFDLSTGSAETTSECDSSDPAAEVLMVKGPHVPPAFLASREATAEATRRTTMRNTAPSPSTHSRGKSFVAGTWMRFILRSLEKPLRLAP